LQPQPLEGTRLNFLLGESNTQVDEGVRGK
jgi:hypothetical protein